VAVVAVVAIAAVAAVVILGRRRSDGVDSFRRQIDALSAESRRTTVDQVRDAARRRNRPVDHRDVDDGEDGVRGS
jgi:hypothetical protein